MVLASMKGLSRLLGTGTALEDDASPQKDAEMATLASRNVQLESALAEERKKCAQKEEEIIKMQKLMSRLETTMDQQAHMSELEKERLNSLETAFGQRQQEHDESSSSDKEQISKLAVALTEAKKRAEQECARADQLQKELNELQQQLQSQELAVSDVQATAGPLSEKLEERTRQVAALQKQLEEHMADSVDQKEQELALKKKGNEQKHQLQESEQKTLDMAVGRGEALDKARAAETKAALLQVQLAEELGQRQTAQTQLAEKEQQLKSLREEQPFDRLTQQQFVQEQVIEKEREVCDLQQQLADELSKRQAVQYQIIEKDRNICELQSSLAELVSMQNNVAVQVADPTAGGAYLHTIEEDGTSEQIIKAHGSYIPNGIPLSGGSVKAPSSVTNRHLPPWLASPDAQKRIPQPLQSRVTLPHHSVGAAVEQPSWAGPSHGLSQVSSSGSFSFGAIAPSQQGSAHCIARSRAYVAASPRAPFGQHMSQHIARRLSQGAATFT